MSGVPLFQNDVLNKTPLVRGPSVAPTQY